METISFSSLWYLLTLYIVVYYDSLLLTILDLLILDSLLWVNYIHNMHRRRRNWGVGKNNRLGLMIGLALHTLWDGYRGIK